MLTRTTITGLSGGMGFFRDADGRSVAFRIAAVVTGRDRKYGSYLTRFRDPPIGGVVYYDPQKIQKGPKGLFASEIFSEAFGQQLLAEEAAKEKAARERAEAEAAEVAEAAREKEEVKTLLADRGAELRKFKLPEPSPEASAAYQAALANSDAYQLGMTELGYKPSIPGLNYRDGYEPGTCVTVKWREFEGIYDAYETTETRQEESTASYGGETWGTGRYHDVTGPVVRWRFVSGTDLCAAYEAARAAIAERCDGGHHPTHPASTAEHEAVCQAYREQFAARLGVPLWILAKAVGDRFYS